MAKSRRKDITGATPKSSSRRTLNKARFFLDQADRYERLVLDYECYVEAALVFGAAVLDHLGSEFGRKRGFKEWIEERESHRLIADLKKKRNYLLHERTMSIIPSQEDMFYLQNSIDEAPPETKAAHEMLRHQLDEIEAIINECETRFK